MSRPTTAHRPLTLTEELEQLEQSITLTLQEIDHNFSRAHRIVTTSILPIVEQYTEHSRDVWEGSKFWKQFFEASANVSLSGYEEQPAGGDQDATVTETEDSESTAITHTTLDDESASYQTPSSEHLSLHNREEDLDLTNLTLSPSHSTPRPRKRDPEPDHDETVNYTPAHDRTKEEFGSPTLSAIPHETPSTPGRGDPRHEAAESLTPMSSPFLPPVSSAKPSTVNRGHAQHQKSTDPLLHRMLDKNYRVQATPLGGASKTRYHFNARGAGTTTPRSTSKNRSRYAVDSSPLSSPDIDAPQLNAEIFSSPLKPESGRRRARRDSDYSPIKSRGAPKPGISVLTPAKKKLSAPTHKPGVWDSDDDLEEDLEEDTLGYSPPKTMQFHIPQSKLLKTPAKEASKRIVSDLLVSAGGASEATDEYDDYGRDFEGDSPSIIRRAQNLEDETF